jgi:hypothetical protein
MTPRRPFNALPFRQGESGLWIPAAGAAPHALGLVVAPESPPEPSMILPFRPVIREGMMAYATESDVGLDTLGRERIQRVLAFLPSEFTFVGLARLLTHISRIRQDSAAQLELVREIYAEAPVVRALGAFCVTEGHVVFSEQGLFALLAQAVIHCRHDTTESFTDEEDLALRRLLLAAPGLLHDDAELADYEDEEPEEWLAFITQNLLFNAGGNFGSGLARTWRMFGELARDSSRPWKTPVDVSALEARVGLTVAQQLALAFGMYAKLGMDSNVIAVREDSWRDLCHRVAPAESADDVVAQIAATPAELRADLTSDEAKRFDPDLRWSSVPFIERPFLRLEDGRLLLVSPRCIEGWPTDGVHYRLLRAARDLDPENGVQHFTSFVGELTEASAIEVLEDAHARARQKHVRIGNMSRARPLKQGGVDLPLRHRRLRRRLRTGA